jgi:hypothetical protein
VDIELKRVQLDGDCTIGRLSIDGEPFCWVCEDTQRAPGAVKVPGQTAIPLGRYRVIVSWSPRFQKPLPLLIDVPGFEGIRIHPGNTAADTDGCLLPGLDRLPKGVGRSVLAWTPLMERIENASMAGDDVWITIIDAPEA